MLIALLVKVGLPLAGVALGWAAKKFHVQALVDQLTADLEEAVKAKEAAQGKAASTQR